MKRLAARTTLAWLMAANAMLLAYQAPSGHPLSRVLGAVGLGYVSIMVIAYATGFAHHLGRANACRFVHRRQRPSTGRGAKQQHAAAIAAVAAKPMQSQHIDDDTAVMPVVTTGVTWGFGPAATDVPPEPWTAPDGATFDAFVAKRSAARRARHAVPEGLPAALQEFDWEPAGSLR